ncbi:MAG: hypothetical protein OEQ53_09910 [Saprospiraceae bacterium]|nr:hypothetical protein [Saprospiraceae bacterium]
MNFDPLEDFIKKNQEAFDNERPSLKVWANIEKSLPQSRRERVIWVRYAAAVAILILGIAMGYVLAPKYYEYQALADLDRPGEFSEMVAHFEKEVTTRYMQLAHDPVNELAEEALKEIDTEIESLKIELVHAPRATKAKILESIIASYETKVHLLENMVRQTNQINYEQHEREVQL